MLYLHCGWPRTSTSSLQDALFRHGRRLEESGLLYPDKWRSNGELTHHGLSDLLAASLDADNALDELLDFLRTNASRDVLLSAEVLTIWLLSDQRQDALVSFLSQVKAAVPVTCVWTLRRLDEVVSSLYFRQLCFGAELPEPAMYFDQVDPSTHLFPGLQRVADAVDGQAIYVRYDSAGSHNGDLLSAFGIPAAIRVEVQEQIDLGPRLNASLSQKAAAIMRFRDMFSSAVGIELSASELRDAFFCGDLEFSDDAPCHLVSSDVATALHERALAAAEQVELTCYLDFFADADIPATSPVAIDPAVITQADLDRLLAHLGHSSRAKLAP